VEEFLADPFAISSSNIVRVFMVSDRPCTAKAAKLNRAGGLLMDRCRIMDCLKQASLRGNEARQLCKEMSLWVKALLESTTATS